MGELAALGAAMCWSVASLLFERFGRSAGGLALNLIKCTFALALMLPTLALLEGRWWPTTMSGSDAAILGASGLVGLSVGDTLWFGCLMRLGARRALLLFTVAPVLTAFFGSLLLGEPFTAQMLAGMVVTLAGVTWVIRERVEGGSGGGVDVVGVLLGVGSAVCQAIGTVLTKLAGEGFPALDVSIVRLAAGTLGLLVIAAATGRLARTAAPFATRRSGLAVLAATFLGTYLGVWLMNAGFLLTWVGVASTMNAMSPIFVLPLAALFLGERVSARSALGAVIAVCGVAILFVAAGGPS